MKKIILVIFLFGIRVSASLHVDQNCLQYRKDLKPNTLCLMPIDDHYKNIIDSFIPLAEKLGFQSMRVHISPNCPEDFKEREDFSLRITHKLSHYCNVVNFKAKIPEKVIINHINGELDNYNLTIVGDTEIIREQFKEEVCRFNRNAISVDGIEYESCDQIIVKNTRQYLYVKLISNNIKNYKFLYDLINNIEDIEKYSYWKKHVDVSKYGPIKNESIVICVNKKNANTEERKDKYHFVSYCDRVEDFAELGVIAVLAPKPFEKEEKTYLPVIFYDTPYLLSEHKDIYPNSACVYDNYFDMLNEGLSQFIKLQKWTKIAVVSDDSPYSDDFEAAVLKTINDNEMAFVTKQCLQPNCDFTEGLANLYEMDTIIIIANVDEKNAMKLVATAVDQNLTAAQQVMWIFRDWPFTETSGIDAINKLGEVFSITVAQRNDSLSIDEAKIMEGIVAIEETIMKEYESNVKSMLQENFSMRSRIITKMIEQFLSKKSYEHYEPTVYLRRLNAQNYHIENIISSSIFSYRFKSKTFHFPNTIYYQDMRQCYFRSRKYDYACEDTYVLIISLVVLSFLLTFLAIVYFFKKYNTYRLTYCAL